MENASKALVIAGGVLLALIILSLLVYMATAATRFSENQEKQQSAKQLAAFNDTFEAYNKQVMYGTEIITLMKKAIENNEKNYYKIDVELRLKSSFTASTQEVKVYADGTKKEGKNIPNGSASISAGTYSLLTNEDEDQLKRFFKGLVTDRIKDVNVSGSNKNRVETTIHEYSALANFKRQVFTCLKVEYSEETGTVSKLIIQEKGNAYN